MQSYILPVKFNIDYRRATLSSGICAGALTRAQALEQLCKPPYDPALIEIDKQYVAKKFAITMSELESIIALPPKSHHDYPNNQPFLENVYRVYRRFVSATASR